MSHRVRQKRGKSRSAKRRDSNSHPERFYLTPGTRTATCGEPGCDRQLAVGAEVVYRHEPREILCLPCAERRGIKYRLSLRLEEMKGRRRSFKSPQSRVPRSSAQAIVIPTRAEIEAAPHTREQLAKWGVRFPPPKGWRRRLLREADKIAKAPRTVWTDGACLGNPGPGGWAIVIERGGAQLGTRSGFAAETTNNAMELHAVLAALEIAEPGTRIISDSKYVVDGIGRWLEGWKLDGWKTSAGTRIANQELWQRIDRALDRDAVSVSWTRGHAGSCFNELADRLATAAARDALPPPAAVAVGRSVPDGDVPVGPITAITTRPTAGREPAAEAKRWAAGVLERVRAIDGRDADRPELDQTALLEALGKIRTTGRAKRRWQTIAIAHGLAYDPHVDSRLKLTPAGSAKREGAPA